MRLQILDQIIEYENKPEMLEDIFSAINKTLENPEYVFLNLTIDGVKVYEEHYEYIMERLKEIQNIKVELYVVRDEASRIMLSASQYLDRAIPEISPLVDAFYQGAEDNESIDKLSQLFEGIQWIFDTVSGLESGKSKFQSITDNSDWNKCIIDMGMLKDAYENIREAVGNMDKILIADILNYEITDILTSINADMKNVLNSGE